MKEAGPSQAKTRASCSFFVFPPTASVSKGRGGRLCSHCMRRAAEAPHARGKEKKEKVRGGRREKETSQARKTCAATSETKEPRQRDRARVGVVCGRERDLHRDFFSCVCYILTLSRRTSSPMPLPQLLKTREEARKEGGEDVRAGGP